MLNAVSGGAEQLGGADEGLEPRSIAYPNPDSSSGAYPLRGKEGGGSGMGLREKPSDNGAALLPVIPIVIAHPEEAPNPPMGGLSKSAAAAERDGKGEVMAEAAKKGCLPRSESDREQCRVCQQQTEEPLMDLGCRCRGELAKAHRSCIDIWFRTRGSNKCEICQHVAANVPSPESQPSTNYWVWRVNSAYGVANIGRAEHERGCRPLWFAFSILIGGLLLDVLLSVTLGVSALPVNIVIGVLIVMALGTVLRLALECFHEWGLRRSIQRLDETIDPMTISRGYLPAV